MTNKNNLTDALLIMVALGVMAAVFYVAPFTTNDGPVHVAFSRFLSNAGQFSDLAFQVYRESGPIYTNLTVYLVLSVLMQFLSPAMAEAAIQAVCLVGPAAAAYFALRQIGTAKTWLVLFIFPLSMHHLFFLGLYNFCFSITGFFLAIGSFLAMQKSPSTWRLLALVAALYATFFSHVAGFLAAGLAIFTLTLVSGVLCVRERRPMAEVIREHGWHIVVFAVVLPLVLLMLSRDGGGTPAKYGLDVFSRLFVMLRLRLLHVHSMADMLAALTLSAMLWIGVARVGAMLYKKRLPMADTAARGALGMFSVVIALCLFALVFPDTLGGGWTHFERMALFPFLAAPLCLAYLPIEQQARRVISVVTVLATLVILVVAVSTQSRISKQLAPLAEVDRIIGQHCSIVPLVFESKLAGEHVNYNPFQHAASRLEYHKDRVVLFNFLARLTVYPVQFQKGRDPHEKLFNWRPQEQDPAIQTVDIAGFESISGVNVDYILQWGNVGAALEKLQRRMPQVMQGSRLVYQSPDEQVRLFMRAPDARSKCNSRSAAE